MRVSDRITPSFDCHSLFPAALAIQHAGGETGFGFPARSYVYTYDFYRLRFSAGNIDPLFSSLILSKRPVDGRGKRRTLPRFRKKAKPNRQSCQNGKKHLRF